MKLRRSLLTSVALILAVLGTAVPSDAKCPFARYRLSFRIVEETTGTPVAGASVAVLANASDQELAKPDAAAPTETGPDGVFAAEYRFNTYSSLSLFGAHRCNERIKTLVVVVRHPRYRERRVTLTAKELSVRPTSDLLTFDAVLRTIEISPDVAAICRFGLPQAPRAGFVRLPLGDYPGGGATSDPFCEPLGMGMSSGATNTSMTGLRVDKS
jgi:hypothetical protein